LRFGIGYKGYFSAIAMLRTNPRKTTYADRYSHISRAITAPIDP
jgi:hypothetical protein